MVILTEQTNQMLRRTAGYRGAPNQRKRIVRREGRTAEGPNTTVTYGGGKRGD